MACRDGMLPERRTSTPVGAQAAGSGLVVKYSPAVSEYTLYIQEYRVLNQIQIQPNTVNTAKYTVYALYIQNTQPQTKYGKYVFNK